MAGFGTTAVVGKAVIRQAFIRQMPTSIRARLATQPDSASLESLAVLADCAVASENDVEEAKQGVAEIQVSENGKLVGLLEDLSRRLKKLETATATATAAKKKNYRHPRSAENRAPKTQFMPNVQAQPFVPSNQNDNRQGFVTNNQQVNRPYVSPPTLQPSTVQPTDTVNAQVCYYHQTFGDKARLYSEPCSYHKLIGQHEVVNIESYPSKLLYVDDKRNKCRYLIDTGAAVRVLP